jgi:maltodextrin utilization protein YvdJ
LTLLRWNKRAKRNDRVLHELAKINSESLNLAVVRDEFDADTFDENLDNEQHVEKNDELASSESDKENEANVPSLVGTLCDVPTSNRVD